MDSGQKVVTVRALRTRWVYIRDQSFVAPDCDGGGHKGGERTIAMGIVKCG